MKGNSSDEPGEIPKCDMDRKPDEEIKFKDIRSLKLSKRVSLVLEDEELMEELTKKRFKKNETAKSCNNNNSYQQLPSLFQPGNLMNVGHGERTTVLPINDIEGNHRYSEREKLARNKLAAVYRIVDIKGWSQGIANHISVSYCTSTDKSIAFSYNHIYTIHRMYFLND